MQKISSYLYRNIINVVINDAAFPVRWKIVYQNRVKIYQGVDNVLTVDVKNTDQKRVDISAMTLEMSVTDVNNESVGSFPLVPSATITGIATATIPEAVLANIEPQFLEFTIYRVNPDTTKTLLYADAAFGAKGNIDLVGNAVADTAKEDRFITRWLLDTNDRTAQPWVTTAYSDAVEIVQRNFLDDGALDEIEFTLSLLNLEADVTVQFTKDIIIGSGITWEDVDTFSVTAPSTTLTRTYTAASGIYSREYRWARVNYVRADNNTGTIDKVIVRV